MELGNVAETVEVSSAVVQVDTSTSTLSEVVDRSRIVELPLNGRDVIRLTLLVPGVSVLSVSTETTKAIPGALRLSTGGSVMGQIAFKLDGVTNTDFYYQDNQTFPFPDALQEFSIQTNNYTAVQGNNAGGIVNVVTRSGTNELHGGVFGFVRNRVFNARNTFASTADFLKRGQYGVFGGGPVRLPHYDGRNKTFYFLGWQGTTIRTTTLGLTGFSPTFDQRAGNFNTCGGPCNKILIDPTTAKPFANNQIPVNRFDPAAVNLLKYLPGIGGTGFVSFGRQFSKSRPGCRKGRPPADRKRPLVRTILPE
jgi:hypothetical protein